MTDTTVYVCTMGGKPRWSRYTFPFSIEAFAQLGDDLFIRSGDTIKKVDRDAVTDDVDGVATNFTGLLQWGWLDFGQAGVTKMLEGVDYVGTGQGPSISIGYDQRSDSAFTADYQLANDTLSGGIIPIPVCAPSMSIKLTYAGGAEWAVDEVVVWLSDDRSPS